MASRCTAALAALFVLAGAAPAAAAEPVKPRAAVLLSGQIQFPRAQRMTIRTDAADATRLTVTMGFDGRCRGGGLRELWAANVRATPEIRARDGKLNASLSGTTKIKGRTGVFEWRLTGRFVDREVVHATVTGSAEVRVGGKAISKCKIAEPASVRLAIRSA